MCRGERAGMMIRVIFMVVFARSDEPKFSGGPIGAQEASELADRIRESLFSRNSLA